MKILVLDNYDSFTYNLVHYIQKYTDEKVTVSKNDQITIEEAERFDKILLSPGPGLPMESGIMPELIKQLAPTKDILGICLGLQAIAENYGGKLKNLEKVFHGVATKILVKKDDLLFTGIPKNFNAGRYHSWAAETNSFPEELEITAVDEENTIMAIRHKKYNVRAVQFHPESILTEYGEKMMENWINEVPIKQ